MVNSILVVNLHSSANAGDHALTLESLRQLRHAFPDAQLTCAYNDPTTAEADVVAVASFFNWVRRRDAAGNLRWNLPQGVWLIALAILSGLIYRLTGRVPRLGLNAAQYDLLTAYTRADIVISSAGNVFYSSGAGVNLLLNYFTFAFGALCGKPLATLPQSFGPLRRSWERWLLGRLGHVTRLMLAREPISARLLKEVGIPAPYRQLVPDVAFAYTERDDDAATRILRPYLPDTPRPLLGITMINWGAQNRHFAQQERYEQAVSATIERFLAESDAQILLFAQVWGPTPAEDDRIPARRVAAPFQASGRVHFVDAELPPDQLKGCYAHLDLLLGTRMHSNIFALSVGVPVVAVGYFTKTAGIMEMAELSDWVLEIGNATAATLPDLTMKAWVQRRLLRQTVQRTIPPLADHAAFAATLIQQQLSILVR